MPTRTERTDGRRSGLAIPNQAFGSARLQSGHSTAPGRPLVSMASAARILEPVLPMGTIILCHFRGESGERNVPLARSRDSTPTFPKGLSSSFGDVGALVREIADTFRQVAKPIPTPPEWGLAGDGTKDLVGAADFIS